MKSKRKNKNSYKFRWRYIAVLIVVSIVLTSCAGTENVSEQGKSTVDIDFSWWGNDERHIYTMEGVNEFMDENPDINVDMSYGVWDGYEKKMQVYMRSNTEADVMQINYDWLSRYSPDGKGYYDLNKLSDVIDLDAFSDEDLKYGESDGVLNAVPIAFNTITIYYNKKIFDSYGLTLPKTWDDLFDDAKLMSKDGKYVLGVPKKQFFLLLLSHFEQTEGKAFFKDDGTVNATEAEIEKLLKFCSKLISDKVVMPIDNFSRTNYLSGDVAGTVAWVSNAGDLMDSLSENGGTPMIGEYLRVNAGDELTGWYTKPATMYAISETCANPEEAGMLLNFLVNSPQMAILQKTEKGVPASSKAYEALLNNSEEAMSHGEVMASDKMNEEKSKMKTMIPSMENNLIIDEFFDSTDNYIYGDNNLNENAVKFYNYICKTVKTE